MSKMKRTIYLRYPNKQLHTLLSIAADDVA
jgi:hypothetical protein